MGLLLPFYLLAFPFMLAEELLELVSNGSAFLSAEVWEMIEKIIM